MPFVYDRVRPLSSYGIQLLVFKLGIDIVRTSRGRELLCRIVYNPVRPLSSYWIQLLVFKFVIDIVRTSRGREYYAVCIRPCEASLFLLDPVISI